MYIGRVIPEHVKDPRSPVDKSRVLIHGIIFIHFTNLTNFTTLPFSCICPALRAMGKDKKRDKEKRRRDQEAAEEEERRLLKEERKKRKKKDKESE